MVQAVHIGSYSSLGVSQYFFVLTLTWHGGKTDWKLVPNFG